MTEVEYIYNRDSHHWKFKFRKSSDVKWIHTQELWGRKSGAEKAFSQMTVFKKMPLLA